MRFPVTLSPWSPGGSYLLPRSMCDNPHRGSPNREAHLCHWSPESVLELVGGWGTHGAWPEVAAQWPTISPERLVPVEGLLQQRQGCPHLKTARDECLQRRRSAWSPLSCAGLWRDGENSGVVAGVRQSPSVAAYRGPCLLQGEGRRAWGAGGRLIVGVTEL